MLGVLQYLAKTDGHRTSNKHFSAETYNQAPCEHHRANIQTTGPITLPRVLRFTEKAKARHHFLNLQPSNAPWFTIFIKPGYIICLICFIVNPMSSVKWTRIFSRYRLFLIALPSDISIGFREACKVHLISLTRPSHKGVCFTPWTSSFQTDCSEKAPWSGNPHPCWCTITRHKSREPVPTTAMVYQNP